jgi:ketosteroid isomerase-like protein
MPLCTEDGVFMPPNNQSAVGKAALRQAYGAVFTVITLNVNFTLAEVVTMSPGMGFCTHELRWDQQHQCDQSGER